jgi:hypothetical protein
LKRLLSLLTATLLTVGVHALALPGLGFSISFTPTTESGAEAAGSIWMGVEQGSTATREIVIRSQSDDTIQMIEFEIYDQILEDGRRVVDYSEQSELAQWVRFSPSSPRIAPGESVTVVMSVNVPNNALDKAHDLNLRALSTAVSPSIENSDGGAKALVGTRIAIDATAWIGVGNALDLAPNFEIQGVDGALINNEKFIRLFFVNNGLVSIKPLGRLQLSDPAFADRVFEPLEFQAPELAEGESGYVDIPVEEEVTDGFYRTFVTAQSAGVRKTALFEGQLIFDDPAKLTIPEVAVRITAFLAGAAGLAVALRMIRRRTKPISHEPALAKLPRDVPSVPTAATKPKPKTPRKPAEKVATAERTAEKDQSEKTTRKRAPTAARSKLQSSDTESKK